MIPALETIDDIGCEVKRQTAFQQLRKDPLLKQDDILGSYAIICYNSRTYRSGGVLSVVSGKATAESELKRLETCQDSAHRQDGWRYFIEKINLKAGTDPTEANQHRQAELETRESKALQENGASVRRSSDPHF